MTAVRDRLRKQLVAAAASDMPRVPEAGRLLWSWFIALHNARTATMAGPQAIAHADIEAFARIERLPLQPHHVAILRAMDDAWLDKARSKGAAGTSGTAPRHISRQEIGPALFDAMFG